MSWSETTLSNQDAIEGLKYLPQLSSLRSEFSYDNLMYIIAGEIIAKLTGKPWPEVIKTVFFHH
ncbi:MAG: CubicO group peptidase (beta-lactamase class C family) [Cognaticolwellia sp.]|jgi:CubicO group peptidase (beta-lactamase class C family)